MFLVRFLHHLTLRPTTDPSVGTTRYFDDPDRPQIATDATAGLKCDRSGAVPIILVPQPSDDPNDPLVSVLWPSACLIQY
jgi:hypothetical protein